ncbi:hypothetical protein C5167_037203 [Papaver somniferum]|uniref:Aminotransferase class V domain-containing protein n=1 Tax=Papaver somniferum TaxID=3469 RepID=A0A4Y7I9S7_PAPSO|nr:hypothetical protein C5167_037203 [Papaver somniferum]
MGIWVPSILRDRIIQSQVMTNEERWVVFVGPYEHHSNILSWRQSIAEVIEIGLDDDGLVDMETLRIQLERFKSENRPMLGTFSACSNVVGIFVDTRAIACLLHEYGAFACFDFAASASYVEIDMQSGKIDGYDAIFLSPHKFLGGPGTPGILMTNKNLYQLRSSPPSTCGGGTVTCVNYFNAKDTIYYDDIEEREDAGTPPIIQKIRASLAFWIKEYIGNKEQCYIEKALKRLLPNPNIWILGNARVKRLAILSFLICPKTINFTSSAGDEMKHQHTTTTVVDERKRSLFMSRESQKPLHGPFAAKLLNDLFGIQARDENLSLSFRATIQKGYLGVKPGWTRISFPYYMSNEEFDFILSALEFIHLRFNWNTGQWTFRRKSVKDSLMGDNHSLVQLIDNLPLTSMKPNDNCIRKFDGHKSKNDLQGTESFTISLNDAKSIADSLLNFCHERKVPVDIDRNLVYFGI